MKVKELIKELMDGHLEDEIKIKLISVSMPDGKTYISNIENDVAIDLNESEIVLTSGEFINEEGKPLTDLLKQCKLTGDGINEFPGYIGEEKK